MKLNCLRSRYSSHPAAAFHRISLVFLMTVVALAAGCQAFSVLGRALPQRKAPLYGGLTGQRIGVMVWADRAVSIDWPSIQLDLSSEVQNKLRLSKAAEIKDSSFPQQAASIVRYQHDHPEIELTPVTDTATKLGVTRLVYIEVQNFSTRAPAAIQMFRGSVTATLQVVEVSGKTAKVAYEEPNVKATFPKTSTSDGTLKGTDEAMYRGVIVALADQVVQRLTTHDKYYDADDSSSNKDIGVNNALNN